MSPAASQFPHALAAAAMSLGPPLIHAAVPSVDSQFWPEVDIGHELNAQWALTGIFTARFGEGLPNPTLSAAGLQVDYRFGSWVASGTGYTIAIRSPSSGAQTDVWLPAVALSYGLDGYRLSVSDRNRVEQLEGIAGSPSRYRNRLSVYWHLDGRDRAPDLFVTDEVFYDFSAGRWSRNRLQAGWQYRLKSGSRIQLYYARQDNFYAEPKIFNILGVTLVIEIP